MAHTNFSTHPPSPRERSPLASAALLLALYVSMYSAVAVVVRAFVPLDVSAATALVDASEGASGGEKCNAPAPAID